MKKVLALVLAAVMALSLVTVVSAISMTGDVTAPGTSGAIANQFYGKDPVESQLFFDGSFTTVGTSNVLAVKVGASDTYSISTSVSSNSANVAASLVETAVGDNKSFSLKIAPAKEVFTVETTAVEVKIVVVQAYTGTDPAKKVNPIKRAETTVKFDAKNEEHVKADFFKDATGKYASQKLTKAVVAKDVFELASGSALELKYADYAVNFAKVSAQNTGLYLKAKTGVVAKPTKAIASIAFQPTRVKDAATVTMPIGADNENLYGEKVYVYALVDGKPSGEAIEGTVVNHNSVIFTVPAGTALGTFAAYGDKAMGDAEKPAIPETGANDIVNIAIVFAVVALAAAGFVAVKKASK